MAKKRDWNVTTRGYNREALFRIRDDERGAISQSLQPYISAFAKVAGEKTILGGEKEVIPLMANDVEAMHLFMAWVQGRNPGRGVTPAHYFVNDHLRQCEAVKQNCAQAFLQYGDVLTQIDNEVVVLIYRFIRAQAGILAEVEEKTVNDTVDLLTRVMLSGTTWFPVPVPLFDTQTNPLRLPTALSPDTVWITDRNTNDEAGIPLLMSLLISFIFLKRDDRDPFNQLKYIATLNPWTGNVYRWDMRALHPGVYNAIINVIEH